PSGAIDSRSIALAKTESRTVLGYKAVLAAIGLWRSEVFQTCLRHAGPAHQGSVVAPSWLHARWARRNRFDRRHNAKPERCQFGERRIKRRGFISARAGRVSGTGRLPPVHSRLAQYQG